MRREEKFLRQRGFTLVAGVDEAGRGPLAGPVVAAAVILPMDYRNRKITDSKLLTPLARERLFIEIKNIALSFATAAVDHRHIDEMGILNAAKLAMRQAVLKLNPAPDFILSDACGLNIMGIPQKAVIHGDRRIFCVAAASILAKVTRDRLMLKYHEKYPHYAFGQHMGYGTELHLTLLKKHGPSPIHRMSFAPVSELAV